MSSDGDSINEWALNEIDLDKPLIDLHSVVDDRKTLVNALFEHFKKDEILRIFYFLKNEKKDDLDLERLKKLCLQQLERIAKKKIIKLLNLDLDGKEADINNLSGDESEEETTNNKESFDDIQMNVDDKEYEEFLNSEFNEDSNKGNNEKSKKNKKNKTRNSSIKGHLSKKEQQNLINELAFPSSTDENLDNCKSNLSKNGAQDEKGWENLWNQTQLEIQELEMRAQAIKAMMEKSKSKLPNTLDKNDLKSIPKRELLDDIESEFECVSEAEKSNENESIYSTDKSRDSRSRDSKSKEKNLKEVKSKEDKSRGSQLMDRKSRKSKSKEKRSKDDIRSSKNKKSIERYQKSLSSEEKLDVREKRKYEKDRDSEEEQKQIEKAVEDEFLEIKVNIKEHKKCKKSISRQEEKRESMESGEILDDEDDIQFSISKKANDNFGQRRFKEKSVSSGSLDSFGRQRRRHRSSSLFSDQSKNSFSSLDEILREAEEEEKILTKSSDQSNKESSQLTLDYKHHHQRSKKFRNFDSSSE